MHRYCCELIYLLAIVVLSTVSSFSIVPSSIITRTSLHTHKSIDVHKLHDQNNIRFTSYPTATKKYTNLQVTPSIVSTAMPILSPVTTDILRTVTGLILAKRISASGLRKRSLNKTGAISAFIVASLSLSTSWRNGITLLTFYWTSSKLTRVGSKIKGKLEEGATEGGERGTSQVLACSLIAVICGCIRRIVVGRDGALLLGQSATIVSPSLALLGDQLTLAYVAFFACCAGDTWASELGILSKSLPRLVTKPWKKVPPGTNGGVSLVGLLASAAGGTVMGLVHGIFVPSGIATLLPISSSITYSQFTREILVLTFVGFMGGLGGSLLDSLLGATIQATYYDQETRRIAKKAGPATIRVGGLGFLSNEMVNVVSTALSALIAALAAKSVLN